MIPASMVALMRDILMSSGYAPRVPWRLHSEITGTAAHRGCASVRKEELGRLVALG